MPFKPEDFPSFDQPDKDTMKASFNKLCLYLQEFYARYKIKPIPNEGAVLLEALERIEKRRVYFHVFHKFRMGELNEGALMCFWIIKLHPFKHAKMNTNDLNACIAVYVLASVVKHVAQKQGKRINLSQNMAENIRYAFRYRDISKEAIMLLAESLIADRS
jgi:hypothetical protein